MRETVTSTEPPTRAKLDVSEVSPLNDGNAYISSHIAWFVCGASEVALYCTCRYWRDLLRGIATGDVFPDIRAHLLSMSLKTLVRIKKYLHLSMNRDVYSASNLYGLMAQLHRNTSPLYDQSIVNISVSRDVEAVRDRAECLTMLSPRLNAMLCRHGPDLCVDRGCAYPDESRCTRICSALRQGSDCTCVRGLLEAGDPLVYCNGVTNYAWRIAVHASACPAHVNSPAGIAAYAALQWGIRAVNRSGGEPFAGYCGFADQCIRSACRAGNSHMLRGLANILVAHSYRKGSAASTLLTALMHASDLQTFRTMSAEIRLGAPDIDLPVDPPLCWFQKRGYHGYIVANAIVSATGNAIAPFVFTTEASLRFVEVASVVRKDRPDILRAHITAMRTAGKHVSPHWMRSLACEYDAIDCLRMLSCDPLLTRVANITGTNTVSTISDADACTYVLSCSSSRTLDLVCTVYGCDVVRAAAVSVLQNGSHCPLSCLGWLEPALVASVVRNGLATGIVVPDIEVLLLMGLRQRRIIVNTLLCVAASRSAVRPDDMEYWRMHVRRYRDASMRAFGPTSQVTCAMTRALESSIPVV